MSHCLIAVAVAGDRQIMKREVESDIIKAVAYLNFSFFPL